MGFGEVFGYNNSGTSKSSTGDYLGQCSISEADVESGSNFTFRLSSSWVSEIEGVQGLRLETNTGQIASKLWLYRIRCLTRCNHGHF